ncbi:MAG TPA: FAD-dependent oxidoreductase [Gaiellales bacterium]
MDAPPRTADLVVIGGGIVGAATAFYAARAGFHPVIVEARPALCTLTTPVSTGAFRLQFSTEEELRLVEESVELFQNFAEITGQSRYGAGVRAQGYLWLTTSTERAAEQRKLVAMQHGWGVTDIELLPGDEVRRRFPYIAPAVVQARYRAGDGFIDTRAVTMGLAAASGASVVTGCRVEGFEIEAGRLTGVRTSLGPIATDRAVIACGPLSGEVAGWAGIGLPIETVRRQKLVMPDVPQVPASAPMTIDEDTGAHWRPAMRGAWLLFTDPTTPASPPTDAVPSDPGFAFQLLDPASPTAVARTAPFWAEVWEQNAAHWIVQAGQYTMTPDHWPLLGEAGVPGLAINTGYSGHGIMLSPAGSRRLADLLAGRLAPADNIFRPDREPRPRPPETL